MIPNSPDGVVPVQNCGHPTWSPCSLSVYGKMRGRTALMLLLRVGVSPPRVMVIRFPDQENWKSLTALLWKVVVSLATAILPGWFQVSESAGKSLSPHRPAASSACLKFSHLSWV